MEEDDGQPGQRINPAVPVPPETPGCSTGNVELELPRPGSSGSAITRRTTITTINMNHALRQGIEFTYLTEDQMSKFLTSTKSVKRDATTNTFTFTGGSSKEWDEEFAEFLKATEITPCRFRLAKTPLEIPYLMNQVFNHLPIQDIMSCRLVCRDWQSSTVPQLRRFRLNLPNKILAEILLHHTEASKFMLDPGTFSKFQLPSGVSLNIKLMGVFFQDFGPYIRSIVITNTTVWSVEDLRIALFDHLPVLEELILIGTVPANSEERLVDPMDPSRKLTKLRKLQLRFTNAHEETLVPNPPDNFGINEFSKQLVLDLLFCSPNLEVYLCSNKRDMEKSPQLCNEIAEKVGCSSRDVHRSFSAMNQFLAQTFADVLYESTPKLIDLGLYLRLNTRGIEMIEAKKYPLQVLDLHVRFSDKAIVISLLQSLGATLKHLRLRVDTQFQLNFSFAFFTELKTLHLEEYSGHLLFLGDMPKLHTVVLDKFDPGVFARKEFLPCFFQSKIRSLSLDTIKPLEKQGKCIKKLSILLPYIKDFTLTQARDSDLLRIFDSLSSLENLKLVVAEDGDITNSGLSGFTEPDAEQIIDQGYERDKYLEYESLRRLPYIGNLKNLKTLALEGNLGGLTLPFVKERLLDSQYGLWVLHGICNLEHLRSLIIHKATLSSIELKALIHDMDLYKLELHNCVYEPQMIKYISKQNFREPVNVVIKKY